MIVLMKKAVSTMTLRKASYLPRVVDEKIIEYLDVFSALSIEGPIWCGKTWAAKPCS